MVSRRLMSSACIAIQVSIDAISVILICMLVGLSFVSSGFLTCHSAIDVSLCGVCRVKGQHQCPIDTAGSWHTVRFPGANAALLRRAPSPSIFGLKFDSRLNSLWIGQLGGALVI